MVRNSRWFRDAITITACLFCFAVIAAPKVPVISNVVMTQYSSKRVSITYHLENAPAIVTLDITTNDVSIGDAALYRVKPPSGAVSKLITTDGNYEIKWNPTAALPDVIIKSPSVKAVVTAWRPANPPDYMVADITNRHSVAYYTSVDALPGGLLDNDDYRETKLVMRYIRAKYVPWTMGSIGEVNRDVNEIAHQVTMTNDYYIGVFPLTQKQYASFYNWSPFAFKNAEFRNKRIGDSLSYYGMRWTRYPSAPDASSPLAALRNQTGIDFDLPGEAQWEFACRAGHGEGCWGDGTSLLAENIQGRYGQSSENPGPETCDATKGTPIAGSYAPNDFGLFDMCGGVEEFCLDTYKEDISANIHGEIETGDGNVVTRGGAWYRSFTWCRPAFRSNCVYSDGGNFGWGGIRGIRLAAPVPAEK